MSGADSQTEPKKRSRRFLVLIAAAVLIAVTIGVVLFEMSNLDQTNYGPGPVEIDVTSDKPFYLQGEEINFTIYVTNPQDWPIAHPYFEGLSIEKEGIFIDGGSMHIDYPTGGIPAFPAHAKTLYGKWDWDQKMDLNGTHAQAETGNYTFVVSLIGPNYDNTGNCTFEIRQSY